jgi:CRP/FNR family transcriptional regulator, anaerobic regulatory protein
MNTMEDHKNIPSQIAPLLDYFQKMIPLNLEEKQLVTDLFKPRLYRKRQYVLQEGDVCNQFNFIVRGCLRMYKVDAKGNTHILQFAAENWWLSNIGSFHERQPSELNIDALEDTMVLQISHANLLLLYTKAPKFDRIFRVLIENSFVSLQKRLLQSISSTAEERYLAFQDNYAHLTNRLPQTQIASFLGITPEFLSRLRNKQAKKS